MLLKKKVAKGKTHVSKCKYSLTLVSISNLQICHAFLLSLRTQGLTVLQMSTLLTSVSGVIVVEVVVAAPESVRLPVIAPSTITSPTPQVKISISFPPVRILRVCKFGLECWNKNKPYLQVHNHMYVWHVKWIKFEHRCQKPDNLLILLLASIIHKYMFIFFF